MTDRILQDKNIVITGASRGFGKYLANLLWESGANLLLIARSELSIESLPAFSNQKLYKFGADMVTPGIANKIIDYAMLHMQRIDVVINNAAIRGAVGHSWESNWAHWEETFRVNLLAPIEMCRAAVPIMIKQGGGKIINLSGGGATNARPNFNAYATTKTGLVRFSETLAAEVRHANIQVNCVAPGVMNTDMLSETINAGDSVKRPDGDSMLKPAELCAFLASDKSGSITGKLVSAVWDPWETFTDEINHTDIYTLRRTII